MATQNWWYNKPMTNTTSSTQPKKPVNRRLVFGMESFMGDEDMEGALPNDNEESTGEGSDISKELDSEGNPLPQEQQDQVRDGGRPDGTYFKRSMEVYEESTAWKERNNGQMPYCPVYAVPNSSGGRTFICYIHGSIRDVDDYIDLIDTLLTAGEKDEYFIFLDSPGGLVASGGIIASAIHHSHAKVHTIARGLCASAAALIHSSAKKENIGVSDFAVIMYHMSMHFDQGSSNLIKMRAENQVRYVNDCLLNKAVEDGTLLPEELQKAQNGEEIFLTAEEFKKRIQTKQVEDQA